MTTTMAARAHRARVSPSRLVLVAALGLSLAGCGVFKGGKHKTPTIGERVPILVSENAAEVDKTLAGIQVSLPPPAVNDSWAQAGGSADKSNGQLALGANPARLWTAVIPGGTERARLGAAPVIDGGKLFAIDIDAVVHAMDANTGAPLWQIPLAEGKKGRPARFGGGVSVEEGRVYATDGLGDVAALNAADGKQLWKVKPGGPLRGSPTIANGNVYVLSQDNQLFALSTADGSVAWTQTASLESQGVFGVAAPASSQGTVVAGFSSGEL
ncbi:MAG: PQQ-binding-like beta-propeller repeat protein, partial [Janthinobacterium lividum]